jgi:murein DD-endopeptidase MepM/ murein hydrolase activator NlpD
MPVAFDPPKPAWVSTVERAAEPREQAPVSPSAAPADAVVEEPKVIALKPLARSTQLANGLWNPMPGGLLAGYRADTGLDIAGAPQPIYALASGTLDYSEAGHTLWTGRGDTANCVRFALDHPIAFKGRSITHVYYAHLSKLAVALHEGDAPRVHVEGGDYLGESGRANGSPHLHIGLLLDNEVEQTWGTFLLESEIREVMGGLGSKARLPR